MPESIDIVDNQERSRYEATIDGQVVGYSEYKLTPNLVVFTHTEVDPAYEGMGVGSALARRALDDTRSQGIRQVLPLCPFVKSWIARHPSYTDLVFGRQPTMAENEP